MATEPNRPAGGTIFHVLHGESRFMYAVDMGSALGRFPDEWKDRPWTQKEIDAYKKRKEKEAKEEE